MSKWARELSPKDLNYGDGWCRDMDRCYREGGGETELVEFLKHIQKEA